MVTHSVEFIVCAACPRPEAATDRAGRPVMPCMRKLSGGGHAVVIDGDQWQGRTFMVHVNMGGEGREDGWYDFDQPIGTFNDVSYRKIYTVRPI